MSSTILADYGADVTKVEMPGDGDAYRRLAHAAGTPSADISNSHFGFFRVSGDGGLTT